MAQEVKVVARAEFDELERALKDTQDQIRDLKAEVKRLSGTPLDIPTDPAEEELKQLRAELKRVEAAYDRALRQVDFARVIAETDKSTAATRRLARANQNLAARGKQVVRFANSLPAPLRKTSAELAAVTKATEAATVAFAALSAAGAAGQGIAALISSVGKLKLIVGGLVAVLGVRQIIGFARGLFRAAAEAVEVRRAFAALVPALTGITGSSELAGQSVEFLDRVSRDLKISTGELIKPYIQLTAALRATNESLDLSDEVFEAVIESGAAFGKSAADIGRVLVGVTQVVGKGVACVDDDVQILTRDGWMHHDELRAGFMVAQHEEGSTAWGELRAVHVYPRQEAAVSMALPDVTVGMTGNHRVVTMDGIVSAESLVGQEAWIPTPQGPVRAVFSDAERAAGVWCPETANGTWLARKGQRQFYTGNSMEEFRQQIGEGLPNAIAAVAKGLGVTIPEAIAQISSGSLEAAKSIKALAVGLRELNQETAAAQLDTLAKNLDDVGRVAELARVAFVDGFAVGLNDVAKEISALETELVGLSSLLGGVIGEILEQGTKLVKTFAGLGANAEEEIGRALTVVSGLALAIEGATGVDLGEPFRKFVADVTGLTAAAEESFKKIEAAAKEAAVGTAESARETEARFRKLFEEIADAAKLSAKDREAIESELVKAIAKVSEEGAKAQVGFQALVVKAASLSGDERLKIERRVLAEATKLQVAAEAKRLETLAGFAVAVEAAAAARIEIEKRVTAENLKFFEQIRVGANELSVVRIEQASKTSTKIEEIELALTVKIEKIQEEFLRKLANPKVDRAKLAQQTTDRIVEAETKAAAAIAKEQERIAKAAEKAAERQIKAQKKVRDDLEKSIGKLKDLAKELDKLAKDEGETTGGPLGSLAKEATTLADKLAEAKENLGKLFGDPGLAEDPLEFLNQKFKDTETVLGGLTAGFGGFNEALGQAGQSTEQVKDFAEDLASAIAKVEAEIESFGPGTQESLGIVLSGFKSLVKQGFVSQQSFENFGAEIATFLESAGVAADKAAGQVSNLAGKSGELEGLKTASEEGAVGIEKLGDEAGKTGQKIVTLADGTKAIVEAAKEVGESTKKGAEGVEELGDAAGEAAPPLEKVADAAEKLREPILGEDEADKLKTFGEAATGAKEPVTALAEPVERIAAGALDLSVALPIVSTALVTLTPELEKLLGLLREDPIDFAAIATQLQTISGPLTEIGTGLTTITTAIVALPDPLAKVKESIGPLFDLFRTVAEDGSIVQVGAGFKTIAEEIPKIPEPVKAFVAALETLVELRDQVVTALADTTTGLEEVGKEELRSDLEDLGTKLADIAKSIGEAATKTEAWRSALEPLQGVLQATVTDATSLATALQDELNPELDKTETEAGEAADKVGELKDEIAEAVQGIVLIGETMSTVSAQVVSDFGAMTAAANQFTAAAEAAAAAAAKINVPQG